MVGVNHVISYDWLFPYLDLLYIYIRYLLERRIYTENIPQIILHDIRAGYLFFFENPKNLGFLCSLSDFGAARPFRYLSQTIKHRLMVISDLIDSPGFVGDHLSFLSHCINSPGIAGDQLGISDLIIPPGLPLVALGLDFLGLVSISSVCSRSRRFALDLDLSLLDLLAPPVALGLDLLGLLSISLGSLFRRWPSRPFSIVSVPLGTAGGS